MPRRSSSDYTSHLSPVTVWVEDDSEFYQATLFHESTSSPSMVSPFLASKTTVSAKDIFFQAGMSKSAKVLLPDSAACIDIPIGKIHMCYNSHTSKRRKSAPVAPHEPQDLLASPTNLPSMLDHLHVLCEQEEERGGCMALAKVGSVFLALRVGGGGRDWEHSTEHAEGKDGKGGVGMLLESAVTEALRIIESGSCASLVISGCSGSGKSTTFRHLMQHLSRPSESSGTVPSPGAACCVLLAGISVLEVFGNVYCEAQQNADSSKFGKYLRLTMQRDGSVLYANLTPFYLEKRLASPGSRGDGGGEEGGETFHVFTLLLVSVMQGINAEDAIGVYPNVTYRGLDNQERLEELDEEARLGLSSKYHLMVQQLSSIGVDASRQQHLFRILGAILLLRNLSFVKKTASGIPSKENVTVYDGEAECMLDNDSFEVKTIAELLGLKAENIGDLLSKKFMTSVRKEDNYFIHLTFDQARFHVNMVAENLYDNVFSWLSNTSNHSTNNASLWAGTAHARAAKKRLIEHYIDIVDFAPLADFETNGFDQLMTNYCNEKIQKHYCSYLFRDEDLQRVKLPQYLDSGGCPLDVLNDCLYMLDGEAGILPLIDEHCLLSRAGQNDSTLFELIFKTHSKHKTHFSRCKARTKGGFTRGRSNSLSSNNTLSDMFAVKHFSGDLVSYSVQGFMRFNRAEKLDKEVCSAFERSTNVVLSKIFVLLKGENNNEAEMNKDQTQSRRFKSKIDRTEISQTKRKVTQIISDLSSTSPIFIKCVRTSFIEAEFDGKYVSKQLKAHGVTDMINLKMKGFSESYSWEEIHALLVGKKLYHFRDELVLEGGDLNSRQCEKLAEDLFERCKNFMKIQFWFETSSPHALSLKNGQHKAHCCLQVGAFDMLLFFKKSKMKDLIYNNYLIYRRKATLIKQAHAKEVLVKFFYCVKLKRQWQKLHKRLLQGFLPMKLFLRRWIVHFRVQKRVGVRIVILFLNRRVWKEKVHRVVLAERAAQHIIRTEKASLLQQHWRGYFTRLQLHDSVTVVVRQRLLARKHKIMAHRIYRAYRRFSLKTWIKEMVYAVTWDKASNVEWLLFSNARISRNSADKVNIRPGSSGFVSLLHLAVGLQHALVVHLLLMGGADPFAYDGSGLLPVNRLCEATSASPDAELPPSSFPSPAAERGSLVISSVAAAETLSVLLYHAQGMFFCQNRDGLVVDETNFYDAADSSTSDLFGVQCGDISLVAALDKLKHLKKREVLKTKHRRLMENASSSTSIIDLIDPADWVSPLIFKKTDISTDMSQSEQGMESDNVVQMQKEQPEQDQDQSLDSTSMPRKSQEAAFAPAEKHERSQEERKERDQKEHERRKQGIKASIFPRDAFIPTPDPSSDEVEEQLQRKAAAEALEAAQQEQRRKAALQTSRAALSSKYEAQWQSRQASVLCSRGQKKRGNIPVMDSMIQNENTSPAMQSFDHIFGGEETREKVHQDAIKEITPVFSSSTTRPPAKIYTSSTHSSSLSSSSPQRSLSSLTSSSLSPQSLSSSPSLKAVANAQQRKRAARRLELEKNATLSFLVSR